jgi:hypothetical protein
MSLEWWTEYYANLIKQGFYDGDDVDTIKIMFDHIISEAQQPYNIEKFKNKA